MMLSIRTFLFFKSRYKVTRKFFNFTSEVGEGNYFEQTHVFVSQLDDKYNLIFFFSLIEKSTAKIFFSYFLESKNNICVH